MTRSIIQEKSYQFALEAIKLHKVLLKEKVPGIPNQFLRSATSIGANVEEAIGGISSRDFHAKLTIAKKEAREANYWLRLIRDSTDIQSSLIFPSLSLSDELIRMLTSATKTMEDKLTREK